MLKIKIKKGMTIIEMLVAITIFTIGIAGFTTLFVKSWQSNAYTLEMGQSAVAVSQGVGKIGEYIRKARISDSGAYAIKSADDNDLVLYSDFDKDGKTERLHFYYQDGTMYMGFTDPSATMPVTYANADQTVETVAERIVNDESTPVFYYYNKGYPGDAANNPVATPADVSKIRLVRIFLKINIDPNHAPDNIEQSTFVELRNLND